MYYKLLTKNISKRRNKVDITNNILNETLRYIVENYPFSTFPYITSHLNSTNATKYLKSGNCVALCIAGQEYLKERYNITSYIIPASIPKFFQEPGYLHICHVGLFIPQDKSVGYILDFSFYFKEPIVINLNNYSDSFFCKMHNLYTGKEEHLKYKLNIYNKKQTFNKYQQLPKNTKYIEICYVNDLSDCWNYYLREIINPDKSITNFYIKLNRKPFLCITDSNYNFKLYIKFLDDEILQIKHYGDIIFKGSVYDIPPNIIELIRPMIDKHFNYNMPLYLNKVNSDQHFCFKDSRGTIKRVKRALYNKKNKKNKSKKRGN